MKVLELFAGTRSIGKAFEAKGHQVFSVEWDKRFEKIDLYADILNVTAADILEKFGRPDVIWASPDCTTFSIAAISHHRRKNTVTGNLDPVSEYAKFCDAVDQHVLTLIKELSPKLWFIENPRGGTSEDDMDARPPAIHRYILPIRAGKARKRKKDEADGHLDESSRSSFQADVPQRGPMPCGSTERCENRNAGAEGQPGKKRDPCGTVLAHC